nr:unnamed protein product [Leishmania braziliensis]
MSTPPSLTHSSCATRRVSFAPVLSDIKTRLSTARAKVTAEASLYVSAKGTGRENARRTAKALGQEGAVTSTAAPRDFTSLAVEHHDTQPATTSHCARDASSCSSSRQSFPGAYQGEKTKSPSANRVTGAQELSLKGTPLVRTMLHPACCKSSPSTSPRSSHSPPGHLLTPSRGVIAMGDARDSTSTHGSNPYTDMDPDTSSEKCRHVVVWDSFTRHEDALRRLALSKHFDLCETELYKCMQKLPSEEVSITAQASSRGDCAAESEHEVVRLKAALANATPTSLEPTGTLGSDLADSLTPLQSPPRSHQAVTANRSCCISSAADVERVGERGAKCGRQSLNEGSPAAAKKAGETNSSIQQPTDILEAASPIQISSARSAGSSCSFVEASRTLIVSEVAKQRPPSQPRMALAAWHNTQKGDLPSVAQVARSAEPSQTASTGLTASRSFTPRSSTVAPVLAYTSISATAKIVEASATGTKTWPDQPSLLPSRRTAASTADTGREERAATKATPPQRCDIDRFTATTPRCEHHENQLWVHHAAALPHFVSPPPLQQAPSLPLPTKDTEAAAATVEQQQPTGITPLRAKALVGTPARGTPVPPQGQLTSPSLAGSALARYRAKQGCQNPASHFHLQLAGTPRQATSATHGPPQRAAATSEPSGVPVPGRGECSVTATRDSSAGRNATHNGAHSTLIPERRQRASLRMDGRLSTTHNTSSVESQEKMLRSAERCPAVPRASAAANPTSTLSPRPAKSYTPAHKLSFECSLSSPASAESSPSHSCAFNAPMMRHSTEPITAASSPSPSRSPTGTSHSLPSDAQQRRSGLRTASASALRVRSAQLSANTSAAHTLTRTVVQAMSSNRLSGAAVEGQPLPPGPLVSLPQNRELFSDDIASWFPSDSAVAPVDGARHLSDAKWWSSEEPFEAERNAAVADGALLHRTTREKSTELRVNGRDFLWDDIVALERRVGGLESCTTVLEQNAAKRSVLEAIRHLKMRVSALEARATLLERESSAPLLQIVWQD